ncbi:carotenoid oxygenase family protein [Halorubrum sp. SD626R]|uniref:carotenoid oxygenase family protein n=1 Tax=Halorubrum sp. SD626R TaxID=1419722 RepID=UPI000A3FAA2A|nr:carotenoid oxygenase family protein [Halorubrum sp. SD626R]TKX81454.1 carotenoid oxygenase family protein [Halorubrum sp. SD626R]
MGSHAGFHSLREEAAASLPVRGDLPAWLRGSLIRNGPGAFSFPNGSEVDHWFDGLAMLYRFTFDPGDEAGSVTDGDGDAVHYRNRFLRTEAYEAATSGAFEGGFATGETTLRSRLATFLTDPYDNANIVAERVGDAYVALTESPRGVRFDPDTLETTGYADRDGDAPSGQLSCAHFKRDPATGALVTVDTEFGRTSRYHVTAWTAGGDRRHVGSVETDRPAYMHSFALTPRYVVLTEFPLRLDPRRFLKPGRQPPFIEQFEWEPERGTRIVVLDRTTGDVVAEPTAAPVFGFHHVNAFERDGGTEVVFDLETVPDATAIDSLYLENVRAGEMGAIVGRVDRFTLDLGAATGADRYGGGGGDGDRDDAAVSRETLYDGGTALPTSSPARWCREHRYVYAMGMEAPVTEWARRVVKLDAESGTAESFDAGGDYFGEPIFVPAPDGEREDEGVVLTVALDVDADRSRLLVLDGETFTERARATLPHAVPFDFHGRYFPELRAASGG